MNRTRDANSLQQLCFAQPQPNNKESAKARRAQRKREENTAYESRPGFILPVFLASESGSRKTAG
jgi:hypothetical protein